MGIDVMKTFVYEQLQVLTAVADLLYALNIAGIRYCHWKSNLRLEAGLNGRTDLDLLVDSTQQTRFQQILCQHQIKALHAAPGKDYPGIENYLGFDALSGSLFHLHVHYQLILGEQYVKNYHLPIEEQVFDSVCLPQGVLIPASAMELIILCLRALLKYRDRDVIKDIFSIRTPGIPTDIAQEIDWLWQQTTAAEISETLRAINIISEEVIFDFLRTVQSGERDGWQLYRLRQQVRKALKPFQRYSRLQAASIYFLQLWRQRQGSPPRKMTLANGGRSLAFIGADGAGKSTMCQLITDWLRWKLDVQFYYLGSKQPSRRSQLLYLLFRAARRSQRTIAGWLGEESLPCKWLLKLRKYLRYSHHLSIGRDRLRRYEDSRVKAETAVVIYDRYPLAAVLDGPKIALNGQATSVEQAFAAAEQKIYDQIDPPQYFLLLRVRPEVSLQRKPDHSRTAVTAKANYLAKFASELQANSDEIDLFTIDANLPFAEVERQLKTAVWQVL